MGQYSKVEIDGRLMTVTINRPEVYNACHPMANEELVAAFDEFHANPELWVAIITGAGDKAFCAGGDLKEFIPMVTENIGELSASGGTQTMGGASWLPQSRK
jgi:enoyl-CoA hydratase/carnithine racemase